MVEEQAPTPSAQAVSEQMSSPEEQPIQGDNSTNLQATEQTVTESHPKDIDQSAKTIQPELPVAVEGQPESLPENPRFFSGVIFFVWVFSTLVFLSVTAGYMATNR